MTCRVKTIVTVLVLAVVGLRLGVAWAEGEKAGEEKTFRDGAFAVDITPTKLPVIVSGSSLEQGAKEVVDPLHARCLVLDDGTEQIAIVVADILLIPRPMMDQIKQLAHEKTGIPVNRMLISGTHAHTAPIVYGALMAQMLNFTLASRRRMSSTRSCIIAHSPCMTAWCCSTSSANTWS